mmetsp:Transcript_9060/g.37370  ORF Transcript_9060/g.37370 Transcript_9060/m.37370 type:complete len:219 (-) Transcript_9060:386-1042(-)
MLCGRRLLVKNGVAVAVARSGAARASWSTEGARTQPTTTQPPPAAPPGGDDLPQAALLEAAVKLQEAVDAGNEMLQAAGLGPGGVGQQQNRFGNVDTHAFLAALRTAENARAAAAQANLNAANAQRSAAAAVPWVSSWTIIGVIVTSFAAVASFLYQHAESVESRNEKKIDKVAKQIASHIAGLRKEVHEIGQDVSELKSNADDELGSSGDIAEPPEQ